jgi:hypothetical protein
MAQGLLQLPTTGTVSGLQNNQDANAALAALAAMVQGGSAPTPASTGLASTTGVLWHDTTNNQIKLRDQADSTWMPCATIDETNKLVLLLLRSYLAGLTLANDGTAPNTKIDVAAGVCANDTNVAMISLPSGGAIDCTTVGANGLDAGALAVSTWYHAFAISKPGGVPPALLASTSLASPAFPTGYTLKRRIGSFLTDASAHILGFVQDGDYFWWKNPSTDDVNTTLSTAATNFTINVPAGISVLAHVLGTVGQASGTDAAVHIYDPALTDYAISSGNSTNSFGGIANANSGFAYRQSGNVWVRTNTTQQVRAVADSALALFALRAVGWLDTRGRLN